MLNATSQFFPRLAATERGVAGPVVVFLHGLGCDRGQFAPQLEGLGRERHLVSLDLPGHGESPELRGGTYTIAAMTRAVAAELRARGYQGCVLVGHSAGGLIGLRLAVQEPDLVRGVVLLDTNIALTDDHLLVNKARADASHSGEWRRHFMTSMTEAWGSGPGGAQFRDAVLRTMREIPEHIARPLWDDILAIDSRPLWRQCQAPSLYIRAKRDIDLSLLRSLNPLASTLDLTPHCSGHWPHLQCPDPVNEAVLGFVAARRR